MLVDIVVKGFDRVSGTAGPSSNVNMEKWWNDSDGTTEGLQEKTLGAGSSAANPGWTALTAYLGVRGDKTRGSQR